MHQPFLDAVTPARVFSDYIGGFSTATTSSERSLDKSLGRPIACTIHAPANLPGFRRSVVDGFAVRASDTFGAAPSNPIFLSRAASVTMGTLPDRALTHGAAAPIPTGGALPPNADSVVMIEDCIDDDRGAVGIRRAVAPEEHVMREDDDLRKNELVLSCGHVLTPADIALLAAFGYTTIKVYEPAAVVHIATGDEIVSHTASTVPAGFVRNANGPLVQAMIRRAGHVATDGPVVPDDLDELTEILQETLATNEYHVILISGGSSAGARDFTTQAIEALPGGRVDLHGIRVSPGKPTVLGRSNSIPVIGLPGHPASCAVVMARFVLPLVRNLAGERPIDPGPLCVVPLSENVASRPGREEYVRVRLAWRNGIPEAVPIRGPSGAISTLTKAHGMVRIPLDVEGVVAGTAVEYFPL